MDDRAQATAWLAAGLVWVESDDAALEATLAGVLDAEVWWRAAGPRLPKPEGTLSSGIKASWHNPGAISLADVEAFAAAWQRVTAPLGVPDCLRVAVSSLDDRRAAIEIGQTAGLRVVPSLVPVDDGRFTWHCPVRVTAGGERAADLIAQLRGLPLAGEYFVVDPDASADLCFLDGDGQVPSGCGTIVAIGAREALDLFSRAAAPGPVLAAGVRGGDLAWWPDVLRALAANTPLDCALTAVVPDSLVGGPVEAFTATTLEVTYDEHGWRGPETDAVFLGVGGGRGAGPEEAEAEPPETGAEAEPPDVAMEEPEADLEAEPIEAEAEAEPPDTAAEPPPAAAPDTDPRRLVVEFRDGARKVRTVLPPGRPLTLEVAIAVPARGQAAGGAAVPDPGAVEEVVTLDVVASGSPWPEPQHAQIAWPVHAFSQPSTSAVFSLTTPASGQALTIGISLLYRGRPLQQADVVAAVRDVAVPGERIRVVARATSTAPSPSLIATPAGVSLDGTGSELRNTFTGASIPLERLQGVLDAFEERISRTLGVDDAPESLSDPAALSLLVDLARQGASLHDQLSGLGLDHAPATAISLLVQPESRVLPLELVYAGAVPRRTGVRLCDHVRVPPAPGEACDRTSARVVCPYAFWALSRTIVRAVVLPSGRPLPLPASLDLQPVLFAASERADFGAPKALRPSDSLAAACTQLFGGVQRVTSWTAWRREVAALRPELLVLLAHTEVDAGEASLQIGRRSFLARPDISVGILGGAPLVLLVACASAVAGDEFGTLPGTFTARGAAAVVGLLTKLSGPQGSRAAVAVLSALRAAGQAGPSGLGAALAHARRDLVAQGLLVGMMLVAHGEIDVVIGG